MLSEPETDQEKSFVQGAAMAEKGNRRIGGRPRTENKADKPMTVYFTEEEREKVKTYCGRVSFSGFVRQLLDEKGVL